MSRLATSFVLGYHGCDEKVAAGLIDGSETIKASRKPYDWLGPGTYFWESDPARALEWANEKVTRNEYTTAAIVGAVIDLGHCLDLSNRTNLEIVRRAYDSFVAQQGLSGLPMPENKSVRGQPNEDRILRFLDNAIFQHLHDSIDDLIEDGIDAERYDTVRGAFTEGERLYEGCGFYERTHVQIAVCNPKCIIGLFKPLRL